jgi:hypothetical protein
MVIHDRLVHLFEISHILLRILERLNLKRAINPFRQESYQRAKGNGKRFLSGFLARTHAPSLLAGEDPICYSISIVMSQGGAIHESPLRFFL